ncbi:MAG: hypothetical protein ACRD0P_06305, partial [Stackebrandtia sp.]
AGLRRLADILEQTPNLPLPYSGSAAPLLWIETHDNSRERARSFVRAVPSAITKDVRDDRIDLGGFIEGLSVELIANRDDVCERVVIGTREVTKAVPDPAVTAPTVTITEVEEVIEWRCGSLLAEQVAAS